MLQIPFPAVKKTVIVIAAISVVSFYYLSDPEKSHVGFACLLHHSTGFLCWGCGGQRAFHELLHGNLQKAFELNALVFPVVGLLAHVLVCELTKQNPSYPLIRKRRVSLGILILVIGFTIFRNLPT
ncbi:DUF2752 domain-containing protein [Dyadobacter sp. CY312]|uniref:DUF2752 domain-containing protein n=1 Tax=Dyadobacter sp. CY312 TaxID=2907303 RepID=UPI001F1FBE0E|nr:DUF2752 domain-containing protein [Dyadobacter sp. CY312]MCE7043481.1 DUF2752 domain-containing protein [Dyadobacter sp. CY312]